MFPTESAGDIDSTERSKSRFKKWGIVEVVGRLIFAPCGWNDVQCLLNFYFSLLPLQQIILTNLGRRILNKLKQDHYVKGQVTRLNFILTVTGFWIRQFFVFSSAVTVPETVAI